MQEQAVPRPERDSRIEQIRSLLGGYELERRSLTGHNKLADALSLASELLADPTASDAHEQVRTLVGATFNRARNWAYVATWQRVATFEELRLQYSNLELFDDPLFGIPAELFDNDGFGEMLTLWRKPFKSWTVNDRKYYDEFFERCGQKMIGDLERFIR